MKQTRPVFFSGGTALRALSQYFAERKVPSVHLVTTFDSGGSTAALRKSFNIPAVGDLRNRLLALADLDKADPALLAFCKRRLPKDIEPQKSRELLQELLDSRFAGSSLPEDVKPLIEHHFAYFLKKAPADFDARGASLGNLLLAASYLENNRDFGGAIAFFTSLFHICGAIVPIVNSSLHLGAQLKNGAIIVGQHHFGNLAAPIDKIFLTVHEPDSSFSGPPVSCRPPLSPVAREYISKASFICYPMGSFYSSILANLLPEGVGKSVAAVKVPKIFIPNSGPDPERGSLSLGEQTVRLLQILREDEPNAAVSDLLNYVLLDPENGDYPGKLSVSIASIKDMGIEVLKRPLINKSKPSCHIPEKLFNALRPFLDGEPL